MYKHFAYSEMLARGLKPISHSDDECHFLKSDEVEEITDLSERLSSIAGMVLVAIDGHNSDFGWNNSDNLVETPQYFITIMKNSPVGDIEAAHLVKEECKSVAFEVVKKMLLDREADQDGMGFLNPDTITFRGVGPIADNFYGLMIGFNMQEPKKFMLNPEMWL